VKTSFDDRVIGLPLQSLAGKRVIVLAGGQEKTVSVAGAVRAGVIDTFAESSQRLKVSGFIRPFLGMLTYLI
jgi:DNA-binding transcriptional regulator LsrR (DeoR family)